MALSNTLHYQPGAQRCFPITCEEPPTQLSVPKGMLFRFSNCPDHCPGFAALALGYFKVSEKRYDKIEHTWYFCHLGHLVSGHICKLCALIHETYECWFSS